MDVLCSFKFKIEGRNLDHEYIKDQWPYPNQDQDANPNQDPEASFEAKSQDLNNMDVLCTFKIKTESKKSEYGSTKDQWSYPNQDQMPNPSQEPPASSKA